MRFISRLLRFKTACRMINEAERLSFDADDFRDKKGKSLRSDAFQNA